MPDARAGTSTVKRVEKSIEALVKKGWDLMSEMPSGPVPSRLLGSRT
jgi:hypothetical protein